MIADARQAKEFAQETLRNVPEGSLNVRINREGYQQYLLRMTKTDSNGKYIGRGNEDVIKELEEKAYCLKLEKVAAGEEKTLCSIREKLEKLPDFRNVFLQIPKEKRHLIEPFEASVREVGRNNLRKWLRNKGQCKYVDPENSYMTQNGERVRSKSELIIADRLREAEIPYHYEKSLAVLDRRFGEACTFHPDFCVLNRRTGRQFYWEHFGMLDDPDYCCDCQHRLEVYADNGYFPGRNLIITSESSRHNLSTRYVDRIIREYLR